MKKTISYYLVLVLGLLLIPNVVKALQVDSLEELKAAFNDTALIEGNKITLTDDVYLDDVIEMTSGDYILDLAGFSFESDGQYFFDLTNTKLVITGDGTIYN